MTTLKMHLTWHLIRDSALLLCLPRLHFFVIIKGNCLVLPFHIQLNSIYS